MTPEQYKAQRKAADHARYLAQRPQRLAKAHAQYHGNTAHRERVKAYNRGYDAGLRRAAKEAATTTNSHPEH